MNQLARILNELARGINGRKHGKAAWLRVFHRPRRPFRHVAPDLQSLEDRTVPSLLGQQLFPSDYPWNQNIANAPVAASSASIISHIGGSIGIHPDWGEDSSANGTDPLYGIPFNVVHGNSTSKINVIIDNYPGESDISGVPIPANAVIEGDYQNGPNPNGGGYNAGQRGDSHMIIWDEDNNIAYELFGVTRPSDPTIFPNTSGVELPHTDGKWHAAQETVWNMNTDSFRTLGYTSADAAGLSILAGLVRPDEGLPIAQGGQGAITHALRFTLPSGDVNPQYIYPASHQVNESQSSLKLPFGARLRLENTPAVNAIIATLGPEAQIIAKAMQQYGLVLADIGSAMFVTGSSASENANNQIALTWNMNDVLGLRALTASDFQVVDLTPVVTGLSPTSGSAGNTITINGQNFSGAAGHLTVYFGNNNPSPQVTYVSDTQITAVVPSGSGTVDVQVQSGVIETDNNSSNPNANVTAPVFGYGVSAASSNDLFTYQNQSISGTNSSFSLASPSVASGSTDVVTIIVRDTNNQPVVGLPSNAFQFTLTGGTSTVTFSAVAPTSTPGTYTATMTGVVAGTPSTVNLTIEGVLITSAPTVTVTPGAVDGNKTTVKFAASSVASGSADTVTIVVEDAAGNAITGLAGSAFQLNLSGGTSTGNFGPVTETSTSGTYTSTFTGVLAGSASSLNLSVSNVAVSSHPTVTVTAGPPSPTNSKASFASPTVTSGSTDLVTIVVKDAAGNAVSGLASNVFTLNLVGASGGTFSPVNETSTPGTYTATFTAVTAGSASALSVTVAGVLLSSQPTVTVTAGSIDGGKSTVKFATPTVASGSTDTVTIIVEDSAGNAVSGMGSGAFSLNLNGGTSTGTFGTVTETSTPGTYTTTFKGVLAGTASSLTATVNGVQITAHPTVTVTAGAPNGGNSGVSLASSTVASGSADVVTIVVKDAVGNHVSGLPSNAFVLSLTGGTSTGSFGPVSETSTPGTYTATLTGLIAGTGSAVNVTVSNVLLNSKPTVTVTAGPVDGVQSSASFALPNDPSGTVDVVTIRVKDAAGNAIAGLGSSSFDLSIAGGTSTGSFGSVNQTSTPGTYTSNFTGKIAGTPTTLTVKVNGVQFATQPTVTVTANSPSPSKSTASFATPSVASGSTDTVTIVVEDSAGNAIAGLASSAFVLTVSGGGSTGSFGPVTPTSTPGTYTADMTGILAGSTSHLTVKVNGVQLNSQPPIKVTPGTIDGGTSSVKFASPTVASGHTESVTITVRDAAGNAINGLASSDFAFQLSGGTSTGNFGSTVVSLGSGVYSVSFTGVLAGSASTLTATVDGVQITIQPTVTVTAGSVNGANSSVSFATPTVASGNVDLVTITVKDAAGNAISGLTSGAFGLGFGGGGSTGRFGVVTPTETPGVYTVTFTGVTAGSASTLTVHVNGVQIQTRPTAIVTPGAVSASNSRVSFASSSVAVGKTDLITLVIRDAAGNAISGLPSSAFQLSLSGGTSDGTFGTATETSTHGTYTVLFTGTGAGTASMLVAVVNGVTLTAQPKVTVTP